MPPRYVADGSIRTPGTSLCKGRIYRFDTTGVVVIDPWPLPRAWTKRDDGPWLSCRPRIDLSAVSPRHAAITWAGQKESLVLAAVPELVASTVVDAHLGGLQWASLQLAARVPGGLELLHDAPVLGAALAASHRLRPVPVKRPHRSARALLRKGRGTRLWRRVARWLGFDDSAAFVRLLRRVQTVPALPLSIQDLDGLRASWADPVGRKRLLHAPGLDPNVLALVRVANEHGLSRELHPGLIEQTFNRGEHTLLPTRFEDLVRLWPVLRPGRRFPRLRSAEELDALHSELYLEGRRPGWGPLPEFPPPPLTSTPDILPLSTPDALREESRAMKNCLHLHSWELDARRCAGFGYRVSADGVRADVWVGPVLGRPGAFRVMEVRGTGNAPAPRVCVDRVQAWLDAHHDKIHRAETPLDMVPEPWRRVWTQPTVQADAWACNDDIPF